MSDVNRLTNELYEAMSKSAYCETCKRRMNSLGVASHRAAHIRRGEGCTIVFYSTGRRVTYKPEADNE